MTATGTGSPPKPAHAYGPSSTRRPSGRCVADAHRGPRQPGELLSRIEAHFNLGAHLDGVAALDRGLITELSPRHSLTELRAG